MYNKKDYYKILNVNIFSSKEKIKKSYRYLAMKYHPDRNQNNKENEEKFKDIVEAYEILSNKEKRDKYNIYYLTTNKYIMSGAMVILILTTSLGIIFTRNKNKYY